MTKVDAILNLHREGEMLLPSFRSIQRNLKVLDRQGVEAGLIVVLDCPDPSTRQLIEKLQEDMEFDSTEIEVSDLSRSRNHAVNRSTAEFISFLDGDDLWCDDWLLRCYQFSNFEDARSILHPSWNVVFGTKRMLYPHPDQNERTFDLAGLRSTNYWTALSFARRKIYLDHPYRPNQLEEGLGYEDRSWNYETIENGYVHRTVPETTHFIRYKTSASLRDQTNASACLRTPIPRSTTGSTSPVNAEQITAASDQLKAKLE